MEACVVVCVVVCVVEDPGVIEAEVYADVAVLFEGGVVKLRTEAEKADGGGVGAPERVELTGGVEGEGCVGAVVGAARAGVGGPEAPLHLEFVGHVVVEDLGGLGDGGLDDGGGGVLIFFGAFVGDVEALVDGGFREADGVGGGGLHPLGLHVALVAAADERELAHDARKCGGKGFQAEVGEPEAEIELIGHDLIVAGGALVVVGAAGVAGGWGGSW